MNLQFGWRSSVRSSRSRDSSPGKQSIGHGLKGAIAILRNFECARSAGSGPRSECPAIAQAEVDDGTAENRDGVRREHVQVRRVNQKMHNRQVAEQRDESVGEMEAKE